MVIDHYPETPRSSYTHTIHVWHIYLYIYHKNQLIVGKYTIHGW